MAGRPACATLPESTGSSWAGHGRGGAGGVVEGGALRVIVQMRTGRQAAKVAGLTGGVQLPGTPKPDGSQRLSRYVDVGADFEMHRAAVESVSVLFKLFDDTGGEWIEVPSGWMVTAAKFEVEWPAEQDRAGLVRSHFGARRFAFNWGLVLVKADLDARKLDPGHEMVGWDLGSLRWVWNRAKNEVAPWWATNSKECYSAGLTDLAQDGVTRMTVRTAAGLVGGSGSRGSNQLAATPVGCGFPLERCA